MDFNIIRKRIVEQADQKKNSLLNYSKPTLVRLGSVVDITAGHGGSKADTSNPGTQA